MEKASGTAERPHVDESVMDLWFLLFLGQNLQLV